MKPFRPNVGICLIDRNGLVFAGRRFADSGPEVIYPGHEWQMPQGGIDGQEEIVAAARRELQEETGVTSVSLLAVTEEWWRYEFPPYAGPPHKLDGFGGQMQRWVAFRLDGPLSEIDISGIGEHPEFEAWGFFPLSAMPKLVVPFRRPVYEKVAEAFAHLAK